MSPFLTTHRLHLTPLSPIHIGCGGQLVNRLFEETTDFPVLPDDDEEGDLEDLDEIADLGPDDDEDEVLTEPDTEIGAEPEFKPTQPAQVVNTSPAPLLPDMTTIKPPRSGFTPRQPGSRPVPPYRPPVSQPPQTIQRPPVQVPTARELPVENDDDRVEWDREVIVDTPNRTVTRHTPPEEETWYLGLPADPNDKLYTILIFPAAIAMLWLGYELIKYIGWIK